MSPPAVTAANPVDTLAGHGIVPNPAEPPTEHDTVANPVAALTERATAAGLDVLAAAGWPESAADDAPPPLAGFVVSAFNPIVAEAARRCLRRRPAAPMAPTTVTAVILASALGDVTSAVHVAEAVDSGGRVLPLMFFQSVPNAVAGHVASREQLTGPVVCVGGVEDGIEVASLLIEDGDADEALLVFVELAHADQKSDHAAAILVAAGSVLSEGGRL